MTLHLDPVLATTHPEPPYHAPVNRLYAPAPPFADAVRDWVRQQEANNGGRPLQLDPWQEIAGLGALAELAGLTVRTLWRYTNAESKLIELRVADQLALALDIPLPLLAPDFQPMGYWRKIGYLPPVPPRARKVAT